jgi:hypothetical protein
MQADSSLRTSIGRVSNSSDSSNNRSMQAKRPRFQTARLTPTTNAHATEHPDRPPLLTIPSPQIEPAAPTNLPANVPPALIPVTIAPQVRTTESSSANGTNRPKLSRKCSTTVRLHIRMFSHFHLESSACKARALSSFARGIYPSFTGADLSHRLGRLRYLLRCPSKIREPREYGKSCIALNGKQPSASTYALLSRILASSSVAIFDTGSLQTLDDMPWSSIFSSKARYAREF